MVMVQQAEQLITGVGFQPRFWFGLKVVKEWRHDAMF